MKEGDLLRVKNYLLRCDGLASGETPNYEYTRAVISVTRNGRAFASLHPEKRFYKASQQPTSYVSIHPTFAEDLYVVLAGLDPDSGKAAIEVFINPLVLGCGSAGWWFSSERCWRSFPAAWNARWPKSAARRKWRRRQTTLCRVRSRRMAALSRGERVTRVGVLSSRRGSGEGFLETEGR